MSVFGTESVRKIIKDAVEVRVHKLLDNMQMRGRHFYIQKIHNTLMV